MKIVDLTLDIHPQAWAVAHLLSQYDFPVEDPFFYDRKTTPWYNGRERGLVFSGGHFNGPVLHIAVFEHRNSDAICALKWMAPNWSMNPPTIESDGKRAYPTDNKWDDVAKSVPYHDTGLMAVWIRDRFEEFLQRERKPV